MTNILILTQPDDMHAVSVKLAVALKGHEVTLCYGGDFPELQTHSISYDASGIKWRAWGLDNAIDESRIDVVWNRRIGKPILPDYICDEDLENAGREVSAFYKSVWETVAARAIWVNPPASQRRVNHKAAQLKIAKEVGLNVPATLISNEPTEIKKFIDANEAIYKTLMPLAWFRRDAVSMVYTSRLSKADLPSDKMLQCSPGIFQEQIAKAYELRVMYFGTHYIAVKIDSQQHPMAVMDWRYANTGDLSLTQTVLPAEVDRMCQLFMWRFGIIFGCFDFIITPEGEYYFLEVNEQGQFLWVEQVNKSIPVLDTFADFLISKGKCVERHQFKPRVSLHDLETNDIEREVLDACRYHKGTVYHRSMTGTRE